MRAACHLRRCELRRTRGHSEAPSPSTKWKVSPGLDVLDTGSHSGHQRTWRTSRRPELASFDFVAGDDFRAALQSDYEELQKAIESGAWKSVHVLAGSIVEAILVDYISGSGIPNAKRIDPLSLDLGGAIKLCRDEGIVTERVASLSDVVRTYRNLIHPGRVIRLGETVDAESAQLAATLVEMVAKEVGKSRAETKGLTAEQLVGKLRKDPSAVSIVPHLLKDLDKSETERLLVKVLPEQYVTAASEWPPDTAYLVRLEGMYELAFAGAPDPVKKAAAERFVVVLREEVESTVDAWETGFFQADMLTHLSSARGGMVKTHLLAHLRGRGSVAAYRAAHGISRHLNAKEQSQLVDIIVREIANGTDEDLDEAARELLEDVYQSETQEADKRLFGRLADWVTFLNERNRPDEAKLIDSLRAKYEGRDELEDLPF